MTAYSGTLELPQIGPWGTAYFEYAQQQQGIVDNVQRGTAFYASGSAYLGPVTVLAEYKDYRNYNNIATSLDPTQVPELALPLLQRAAHPGADPAAGVEQHRRRRPRVRVDMQIAPEIVPFVSMAYFDDRIYQTRIFDPYAGVELRWQDGRSRASVSGGERFRRLQRRRATPPRPTLPGGLARGVRHQLIDHRPLQRRDRRDAHQPPRPAGGGLPELGRGAGFLSFKRANLFSAALGYEYYTEAPATIQPHYFNVSGSWTIRDGTVIRLFAGGQRAGIKCVDGVCRNYPPSKASGPSSSPSSDRGAQGAHLRDASDCSTRASSSPKRCSLATIRTSRKRFPRGM